MKNKKVVAAFLLGALIASCGAIFYNSYMYSKVLVTGMVQYQGPQPGNSDPHPEGQYISARIYIKPEVPQLTGKDVGLWGKLNTMFWLFPHRYPIIDITAYLNEMKKLRSELRGER